MIFDVYLARAELLVLVLPDLPLEPGNCKRVRAFWKKYTLNVISDRAFFNLFIIDCKHTCTMST
jgi:hypothetical protein